VLYFSRREHNMARECIGGRSGGLAVIGLRRASFSAFSAMFNMASLLITCDRRAE